MRPVFFSAAGRPLDEAARQAALDALAILDTPRDPRFDRIVEEACTRLGTPIAAVSLVDRDRQWFKAIVGLDATETPRAYSFCAHCPHEPEGLLVVPDATRDTRFRGNPLVTGGPEIRFYAGALLRGAQGHALGALCVIDRVPHAHFTRQDRALLQALAQETSALLLERR